jgi:spermine oxidase
MEVDVVIIGAGMAGLSAGRTIMEESPSASIAILEASDRIGGRVLDLKHEDGSILSLGATWMHSHKDNPLYDFAVKHGHLEVGPATTGSESESAAVDDCWFDSNASAPALFVRPGGRFVQHDNLVTAFNAASSLLSEAAGMVGEASASLSVDDHVRTRWLEFKEKHGKTDTTELDDVFAMRMRAECAYTGSASLADISLRNYGQYSLGDGHNTPPPRGFSALIAEVARPLLDRSCIMFNSEVCDISPSEVPGVHGIKVRCHNDTRIIHAQHVICTVSLGVLQHWIAERIVLHPSLPVSIAASVHRLGFGRVEKLHAFYDRFWWRDIGLEHLNALPSRKHPVLHCGGIAFVPDHAHADDGFHRAIVAAYEDRDPIAPTQPVLTFWLLKPAGDNIDPLGKDPLSDDEVHAQLEGFLEAYLQPHLARIPHARRFIRSGWGSQPLVRGSYTYIPLGADVSDILALQEGWAVSSSSTVLFSGEATHEHFYSTLHGAFAAGRRDGTRIVHMLGHRY